MTFTRRLVAVLAWLAMALDLLTTHAALTQHGDTMAEANPVAAFLIEHAGWWGVAGVSALICLAMTWLLCDERLPRRFFLAPRFMLGVIVLAHCAVVASNVSLLAGA